MAYASWSVVFGEQPSAAKWNILGTNDASFNDGTGIGNAAIKPVHLATGLSSSTWAWQTWTPVFTNFTKGNATINSKYAQIGKTIHFILECSLGSTSSMGSAFTYTLPVTSVSYVSNTPLGSGYILDASAGSFNAFPAWASTTTGKMLSWDANNNGANLSSTAPMTWTTSDTFQILGSYEAA